MEEENKETNDLLKENYKIIQNYSNQLNIDYKEFTQEIINFFFRKTKN